MRNLFLFVRYLAHKQAVVLHCYPFTLVHEPSGTTVVSLRLKIDPGSRTTGLAIVDDMCGEVVWAAELTHRGQQVRNALTKRRDCRRSRRQSRRFLNRQRKHGWLPPSLESRLANVLTWVARLQHRCPIGALSLELVKFDTQLLQHANLSGVAYRQGELAGYELRQYLLEKFGQRCAYCGTSGVPLEVEHIIPRSRGGSDRVSNLTIACHACNESKGKQTAAEFGHLEVQARAKAPLRDAAAANSMRWALYHRLEALGLRWRPDQGGERSTTACNAGYPRPIGWTRPVWARARQLNCAWLAWSPGRSGLRGAIAGRCAAPMTVVSPIKRPKRPVWSVDIAPASWCGR